MRHFCWHIPFRRVARLGRTLGSCALVPVLLVSSVTTQAVLIHNHYGHEIHAHTVAVHDLDVWKENSEHHQHGAHEHNDRPTDPSSDEDQSILIVLDLPVALPRALGVSAEAVVSNTAPATTIPAIDTPTSDGRPRVENRTSPARLWHARSLVADLLLTSHALLL